MSEPLNLRPAEEVIDTMFVPYRKRIAELERENVELRKDAERIDWLAAHPIEALDIFGDIKRGEERFVRKIIDAAIASEKENERG